MERKMRRGRQLLSAADSKKILEECTNGILSLVDTDGEPYGVPLSFAYDGEKTIYFHSAVKGRKIDCVTMDSRCSFCVVGQDMIKPEEFTTYFRSVIVRGNIRMVTQPDEVMKGLQLLCEKYSPGIDFAQEISRCLNHVALLRLDIESISGKEAIELVRARN